MIAFLGMYDMPALRPHNDAFWAAIRAQLGEGPDALTRADNPWPIWQSPDLLFAQTCGFPFRARLHDQVQLVGTPDYGLEGCAPGYYRSAMVARAGDPADPQAYQGKRLAYNEALSQSGWAAPISWLTKQGLPMGALVETGAHAASARAVAEGRADLAGLDALTWELLGQHDPDLAGQLKVIGWTEPTPALPYITAHSRDADRIAAAVRAAIEDLPAATRAALHLRDLVSIPAADYRAVPIPTPPTGYRTAAEDSR